MASIKKEGHMVKYKEGKFKSTEQTIYCKLLFDGQRPRLQCCKHKEVVDELQVKKAFPVGRKDLVPKLVKASYENYIYVQSKGGDITYLGAKNREERDIWCELLQYYLDLSSQTRKVPCPAPRPRMNTDARSNRPPPSRGRIHGDVQSAPGTAVGIFQQELAKPQTRGNGKHGYQGNGNDGHVCCQGHECRPSEAIRQRELYNDLHNLHHRFFQPGDDVQEIKDAYGDIVAPLAQLRIRTVPGGTNHAMLANRLSNSSNSSTSSEESTYECPLSFNATRHQNFPVESSWPPSSPEYFGDSADEVTPDCVNSSGPPVDGTTAGIGAVPEPEAHLCLPPKRSAVRKSPDRAGPQRCPPVDGASAATAPESEASICLPPKKSNVRKDGPPCVKPKPHFRPNKGAEVQPMNTEGKSDQREPSHVLQQYDKLVGEKIEDGTQLIIPRECLSSNINNLQLRMRGGRIMVTHVPPELRDIFHIGDQWLKINDQLLDTIEYACKCIELSDKTDVKLTVRRIPFATMCKFHCRTGYLSDIGLTRSGTKITDISRQGLAVREGNLQSKAAQSMYRAGTTCSYVITEINFHPVDPYASTQQVDKKLQQAGEDIVLILHPEDLFDLPEEEAIYENIGMMQRRGRCNKFR